jgi:hypothetical protein
MLEQKDRTPIGGILLIVALSAIVAVGGYLYAQKPQEHVTTDKNVSESTSTGASDFLRQKAQERREFIDSEYSPDAYGGSNWSGNNSNTVAEQNTSGTSTLDTIRKRVEQAKAEQNASSVYPVPYYNGEVVRKPNSNSVRRCPLSIEVKGDDAYYIHLKALHFSMDTMGFMVAPGSSVELDVPTGRYEIYYATGKTWYGIVQKFGAETAYYKCEGTFQFTESSGWALELYEQVNGNLDTDKISANDFP